LFYKITVIFIVIITVTVASIIVLIRVRWTRCQGGSQWQFSQISEHRSTTTWATRSQYTATTNRSRETRVQTSHRHTAQSVNTLFLTLWKRLILVLTRTELV